MSGKVLVCRCEDVTLESLEEAVDEGHHDIESLKRYTGFATGWCQGRQCVALCARLLAARVGRSPELPITPRPPTQPVALGDLAGLAPADEGEP